MITDDFKFKENFSFLKNLMLIASFFIITPLTLAVSLFSLFYFNTPSSLEKKSTILVNNPTYERSGMRIYASLPSNFPTISGFVQSSDARPEIIRKYLTKYNSPLEPYSNYLVETSDKYNLDFRLLPAIAQQESNLCKIIPAESHNCWGWGIHSKGSLGFESYEESIKNVALGLKEEYIDKGYRTPDEIMTKYTPLSDGSWARGVTEFMNDMQ